jgi:hypothetical protein
MLLLTATRLTTDGRFSYMLEVEDGTRRFATEDSEVMVRELARLGVADAALLVVHSRTWGEVEIHDKIGFPIKPLD